MSSSVSVPPLSVITRHEFAVYPAMAMLAGITALDLPKVIPVTRRFLEEEGAASRVATLVGDMIAGAPEGTYDVAVLRALIQVLSLADAQEVVRHVAQSLAQNGTILIIGAMMEDSRLTPPNYVGQNLVFLNIYDDGLIYTEGEYRGLLLAAGFTDIIVRRGEMPTGQVLISTAMIVEQDPNEHLDGGQGDHPG